MTGNDGDVHGLPDLGGPLLESYGGCMLHCSVAAIIRLRLAETDIV